MNAPASTLDPIQAAQLELADFLADVEKALDGALPHARGDTLMGAARHLCMGGGGKRDAHSYEVYDRETGIAVFTSPSVKPGVYFLYFDPLGTLEIEEQRRWQVPTERRRMIDSALESAREQR